MRTFYVPPVQSERRGGCVSRDKPRKGYAHHFSNNFIFPPFHESSSLDSRPVLFSDIVTSSSFCDREANKQAAERDTGNAVNKLTFRPDPLGLKRKPVLGEFVLAPLLLSLSLFLSLSSFICHCFFSSHIIRRWPEVVYCRTPTRVRSSAARGSRSTHGRFATGRL